MNNFNFIITIILFVSVALFLAALPLIISQMNKNKHKKFLKHIALEKIPAEFEKTYTELYNDHISKLEKIRKSVMERTIVQFILYVFIIIGYYSFKLDLKESSIINISILSIFLLSIILSAIITPKNYKFQKNYKTLYKKEIVANFIKLINNQLTYIPNNSDSSSLKISQIFKNIKNLQIYDLEKTSKNSLLEKISKNGLVEDVFKNSQMAEIYGNVHFDNKSFNQLNADDYIEGYLDEHVFIKMCDLDVGYYSNGRSNYTETIFKGLFSQTTCTKDIGTYIKISKHKINLLHKDDSVLMDNQDFEKHFDIYSENKIVAMQLLTSDTMELLLDFYNKYSLEYEIVIKNNSVYMRFFTGPMFEPKVFGSSMDKQLLFIYYCVLKFVLDVTQKFNKTMNELEI